ncbi:hypothetical protein ESB04_03005 [Aquirufa rosea]|uniref:T9SS type B sorting domain-containing protein n=2 Tax=Aquirufa rosea TaxID=2509241 RepID=A0A4Q1C327_9BACT|nr:hypothetical protein ESB04_03005 [Aquirufa rosea]
MCSKAFVSSGQVCALCSNWAHSKRSMLLLVATLVFFQTFLSWSLIAGPAVKFRITGTSTQVAGSTQTITIEALDLSSTVDNTYQGNKSLVFIGANNSTSGSKPTINSNDVGVSSTVNFTNGVATVSMVLYKAEEAKISAADGTITTSDADKLTVTVSPTTFEYIDLELSNTLQYAGKNFTGTFLLRAKDRYQNLIPTFNAAVNPIDVRGTNNYTVGSFVLGYGGSRINRSTDFVNGVADLEALGIKYTGSVGNSSGSILFQSGSIINDKFITLRGGDASKFKITSVSTNLTAGVANTITITALDQYGNESYTFGGTKSLVFSGASASPDGTISTVASTNFGSNTLITFNSSGIATASMRLYKAGSSTISVTNGTISSTGTDNLTVNVAAAALSKFGVSIQSPQQSEKAFTGTNTVSAQDQYGNVVSSFNASTDNVTATTTLPGTISGLPGVNKLTLASNFVNGVANLTSLGMIYTGQEGSGTFTFTSNTGKTGTSQLVETSSTDEDGDGIPNSMECYGTSSSAGTCEDFDGDGKLNSKDTDSDGDGIDDSIERNIDTDGDRHANYLDLDSDNDGILDAMEGVQDSDGDGVPNYLDLDADGDGILDAWEGTDTNRGNVDDNYDGKIDVKGVLTDNNGNGLADILETSMGGKPLPVPDTDRDGKRDYIDLDSDNDGILDQVEGTVDTDKDTYPNYRDLDADGDWLGDQDERNVDNDGDGIPNYLDADSDGDTIPDSWEGKNKCATCLSLKDDFLDGWDDRGQFMVVIDADKDGTSDFLDLDSDNDSIPDSVELGADVDGDEIANFRDIDSDNDGILDNIEAINYTNPIDSDGDGKADFEDMDSDNDGIGDKIEAGANPLKPVDSNGDGKPDYLDIDSDGDGISDAIEVGKDLNNPLDSDGDGIMDFRDVDADNDTILDKIEVGANVNKPVDSDADGVPDYLDLDSDNDTILDRIEAGPDPSLPVDTDLDAKRDYVDMDSDDDSIPDQVEVGANPLIPLDTDGDMKANFRDSDSDNDGILDKIEAGINPSKPMDSDLDAKPDYLDLDSDDDTIGDLIEAGLNPFKPLDSDNDTKPDYIDIDSDNDGLLDALEVGNNPFSPIDSDRDGFPNYRDEDSDNDGILDRLEAGSNFSKPVDTDKDGLPDYMDIDSDNDGMPDRLEAGADYSRPVDTDKDQIPDYRDLDSDNDLIPDKIEAGPDSSKPLDSDRDGLYDYQDLDSDNNSIADRDEFGNDPNNPVDTDKNGAPDYRDLDNDGDGISDVFELDINYGGLPDCDQDGISNMNDKDVCEPFAPQGISPNGDGKNDKLIIPGLYSMPKHHITIFNRIGAIIFESDNYKNDWGGEFNFVSGQPSNGEIVPDGVYYYVIDFAGVKPAIQSFIYINRMKLN